MYFDIWVSLEKRQGNKMQRGHVSQTTDPPAGEPVWAATRDNACRTPTHMNSLKRCWFCCRCRCRCWVTWLKVISLLCRKFNCKQQNVLSNCLLLLWLFRGNQLSQRWPTPFMTNCHKVIHTQIHIHVHMYLVHVRFLLPFLVMDNRQ